MQLVLERPAERSIAMALASPLIAVALTLATGAALFALLGKPPAEALKIYFLDPLRDPWALQEFAVKATPLVLIAVGLSLCYLANAWNIGAEGQFLIGAICGGWLAVKTHGTDAGYCAPCHARAGHAWRSALRGAPGTLQGALRRKRDFALADAGVRRRALARLPGARALARPERLQLPDHSRVRRCRLDADLHRGQPAALWRDYRAIGGDRSEHRGL